MVELASGYGRELFFSNIILFIAENYKDIFVDTIRELTDGQLLPDGFDYVRRERNHLDLVFIKEVEPECKRKSSKKKKVSKPVPVLVIENKSGSIATPDQLNRYTEKFSKLPKSYYSRHKNKVWTPKDSFLLLSALEYDRDTANDCNWHHILYKDFAKSLIHSLEREVHSYSLKLKEKSQIEEEEINNLFSSELMEYKFIIQALQYMVVINDRYMHAFNSVSPESLLSDIFVEKDTTSKEASSSPDSSEYLNERHELDSIKRKYLALSRLVKERLETEGLLPYLTSKTIVGKWDGDKNIDKKNEEAVAATGDRAIYDMGANAPSVRIVKRNLLKNWNLVIVFQGNVLKVGFSAEKTSDGKRINNKGVSKIQKKEQRSKIWDKELKEYFSVIAKDVCIFDNYEGTGFSGDYYILPMAHYKPKPDTTVNDLIDILVSLCRKALDLEKRLNRPCKTITEEI